MRNFIAQSVQMNISDFPDKETGPTPKVTTEELDIWSADVAKDPPPRCEPSSPTPQQLPPPPATVGVTCDAPNVVNADRTSCSACPASDWRAEDCHPLAPSRSFM